MKPFIVPRLTSFKVTSNVILR